MKREGKPFDFKLHEYVYNVIYCTSVPIVPFFVVQNPGTFNDVQTVYFPGIYYLLPIWLNTTITKSNTTLKLIWPLFHYQEALFRWEEKWDKIEIIENLTGHGVTKT